jgi:hypothetical protein
MAAAPTPVHNLGHALCLPDAQDPLRLPDSGASGGQKRMGKWRFQLHSWLLFAYTAPGTSSI